MRYTCHCVTLINKSRDSDTYLHRYTSVNTSFIADENVIFFFVVFASSSGGADGTKLFSSGVSGVFGGSMCMESFLPLLSFVDVSLGNS